MMANESITVERLREYCHAYDELNEIYPEHAWEGQAVLEFIIECEGLE